LRRPVLTTTVAGIPELVQHGVSGWLVPPGSIDALTTALREVLDAPPERLAELGAAGARRVAERHDATVEAGKLRDLIAGPAR
jgi:glycosyltransferase involved in cell wall biosynthesis